MGHVPFAMDKFCREQKFDGCPFPTSTQTSTYNNTVD